MAPRLMPWATVTIRLCAAWRNTSVRRTSGTAPEAMMSASTCPGPTKGSWSTSPTISSAASSGTAANSDRMSSTSTRQSARARGFTSSGTFTMAAGGGALEEALHVNASNCAGYREPLNPVLVVDLPADGEAVIAAEVP